RRRYPIRYRARFRPSRRVALAGRHASPGATRDDAARSGAQRPGGARRSTPRRPPARPSRGPARFTRCRVRHSAPPVPTRRHPQSPRDHRAYRRPRGGSGVIRVQVAAPNPILREALEAVIDEADGLTLTLTRPDVLLTSQPRDELISGPPAIVLIGDGG